MSSKIEWTDETWNPLTGCTKVSPGCDHCYAKTMHERFNGPGSFDTVTLQPARLEQPLHWRRPRRVFVNSMSDLFHDDVPDDYIAAVFGVMAAAREHTFQVLTKRHARMKSLLNSSDFHDQVLAQLQITVVEYRPRARYPHALSWPLPNVWLGVSVEDQKWADIRIPALLDTPAAVRFLSCEPLLGPVSFRWAKWQPFAEQTGGLTDHLDGLRRLDWVIVGGESGQGARPMHPDWVHTLRDQCSAADVPFLFKQWGAWAPSTSPDAVIVCRDGKIRESLGELHCTRGHYHAMMRLVGKKAAGRELDGRTWDEYPAVAQ